MNTSPEHELPRFSRSGRTVFIDGREVFTVSAPAVGTYRPATLDDLASHLVDLLNRDEMARRIGGMVPRKDLP